ncbi:hypothetical protein StoSoilA2_22700 [Arthrobacter sp. StoSoilA2]|nr:hypothetical protein StoSoilA2_22700 [Arthrobacter sp. StoSoilA2]
MESRDPPGAERGMRETALKLVTKAAAMMRLRLSMAPEPSPACISSRAIDDDVVALGAAFRRRMQQQYRQLLTIAKDFLRQERRGSG